VRNLTRPGTLLRLTLPGSGLQPLTFRRRTKREAPADATYRLPRVTGDGWSIAAAPQAGLATAALKRLERFAAGTAPTSVGSPAVHAVLVARHGKLVVDDYFAHFGEATLHDTRSAGKTYADLLAGAAIEAGVPLTGDTLLRPLFAPYGALANPDPRKGRITLGDALSMATGLDCDDNDEHSAANEDNEQSQTAQPDWYRLVLDSRLVRDPGTKAVYCSASINLAGGAIAAAAHAWLPAYFAQHVAQPLQMQRYALNLTPTGQWYLGGGAYVRPRDFLKIGQVFLDGGTWHGRRILPRWWIERSWNARLALAPGDGYGYAWHVRSYTVRSSTYRAYEAQGNGGQILDVLPQLDLVVMITQGNYNNFRTWGPTRDAIVTRIINAIAGR
jgi:CubicO group peptidase (beta-lactamase class C family)